MARWQGNKQRHRKPLSNPYEVTQDLCLGDLFLARHAALAVLLDHVNRRIVLACMEYKDARFNFFANKNRKSC